MRPLYINSFANRAVTLFGALLIITMLYAASPLRFLSLLTAQAQTGCPPKIRPITDGQKTPLYITTSVRYQLKYGTPLRPPFGNGVRQTLTMAQGSLSYPLMQAIRPHM